MELSATEKYKKKKTELEEGQDQLTVDPLRNLHIWTQVIIKIF